MHQRHVWPCLPIMALAVLANAGTATAQQGQGTAGAAPGAPPGGAWQTPGEIHAPSGPWQTPGEIHAPTGPWQTPGEIQVPKGIQALRATDTTCERRVSVVADALFDFDKSVLRPDAVETLAALGPEIAKAGRHPVVVEGHTDNIGTDAYNLRLSEQRARTVRDWLARQGVIPADTPIKGYGKTRPVAPNQMPDARDNPEGRQKNRRVEVAINTCG